MRDGRPRCDGHLLVEHDDRVGLVGERRRSTEVAHVRAAGVEAALISGGHDDDRQLLVEGQLLQPLDDSSDTITLVGTAG